MINSRYKLNYGSQVREEDFGLLFYKMQGPRLYFVSSSDLLPPDFFNGDMTLEEWLGEENKDIPDSMISELRGLFDHLCENGVIIEY